MIFSSWQFLVFFVLVLVLNWTIRNWTLRKVMLLLASFYFYMYWNRWLVLLMLASTSLDYLCSLLLVRTEDPRRRKLFLLVSLTGNLGLLAFFKYWDFVLGAGASVLRAAGLGVKFEPWDVALPVGISFYTFEGMSYVIDVYRRRVTPSSPFHYLLFITFFPKLIAGPIVRAGQFIPQLAARAQWSTERFWYGLDRLLWGLAKKVLVADQLSGFVDRVWAAPFRNTPFECTLAAVAFVVELYADFSGYSDMALGAAEMLGFTLPENFRAPYIAASIGDLWRRWHITLGSWIRDYVYIPLGGSRHGLTRTGFNLIFSFGLVGLWHGAAWHFVVFGLLQGTFSFLERLVAMAVGRLGIRPGVLLAFRPLQVVYVMFVWTLSLIVFRSPDLDQAWTFIGRVLEFTGGTTRRVFEPILYPTLLLLAGGILNTSGITRRLARQRAVWFARGMLYMVGLVGFFLFLRLEARPFVYFQF